VITESASHKMVLNFLIGSAVLALFKSAVLFAPPEPQEATSSIEARLEALDRRAAETVDITADFEEEKFTPLLKKPMRSTGTVRVAAGRTRWDTTSPYPVMLLLEGQELRIYFPQRQAMEIYPLADRLAQLAFSPQPRLADLRAHFELLPRDQDNGLMLELTPKAEELRKHVQLVRVTLDEKEGVARRVELISGEGERTVITFHRVRRNQGLGPAALDLHVPDDTVITHPLKDLQGGGAPPAPRSVP